ncbi:hypothetical protein NL676_029166 [Syzygium grande]|nr:hypothetical protein NL676_029166 [Syzygium grande]
MQAPSSPSLPPRNPRNPQMRLGMRHRAPSPSEIHLPTPRRVTFCKGRGTLLNKASALCVHTGARAAVIVFSSKGKLYSSDDLSVEEMAWIISDYVHRNGGAMPPMGPKEGWTGSRKRASVSQIDSRPSPRRPLSSARKPTLSLRLGLPHLRRRNLRLARETARVLCDEGGARLLNFKYEPVLHYVMREKLKDISGSGNSGVGAGCDSEVLNDDNFNSLSQSEELKDIRGSGNSGVGAGCDSEVLNDDNFNSLSQSEELKDIRGSGNSGVGAGCDSEGLNDDDIDSILQRFEASQPSKFCLLQGLRPQRFVDCTGQLGRRQWKFGKGAHALRSFGFFLTSPVNLAVAGGSLGVESTSTLSDLEGREFVDSFLDLSGDLVRDGYLIPPENSTGHGGSSGEEQGYGYNPDIFSTLGDLNSDSAAGGRCSGVEWSPSPTRSDLDGYGYIPDDFLSLFEYCVGDYDCDSFLTSSENSAVGGGSLGLEFMRSDLEGDGH